MEKTRLFIWPPWELSDHTRSMEWQHSTVTSSKKRSSVIFMRSTLSALQTKQTELPPVDGSVSVTGNWLICSAVQLAKSGSQTWKNFENWKSTHPIPDS